MELQHFNPKCGHLLSHIFCLGNFTVRLGHFKACLKRDDQKFNIHSSRIVLLTEAVGSQLKVFQCKFPLRVKTYCSTLGIPAP